MADIVLHHYEASPFSELVRLALGMKRLKWKSVIIPNVSPKPDLCALTGGYERTPVLQIGADIYCDTAIIVDALEAHSGSPTFYPQPLGFAGRLIALWAGGPGFMPAVGAALGSLGDQIPDRFWEDRGRRFGLRKESFPPLVPHLEGQFSAVTALLAESLSDGRPFIGGDAPGHADLACYMLCWFQSARGQAASSFAEPVGPWMGRIASLGHGEKEDWAAEKAIEHAKASELLHDYAVLPDSSFKAGDHVAVSTESPDPAEVAGTLLGLDERSITIAREDERAGKVHVHFPRFGQVLKPAG